MYSWEISGQIPVQWESMNSRTTTLPRKPDKESTRPSWSVSVKPGAGSVGTRESPSRLTVVTGIPASRCPPEAATPWCRPAITTAAAIAATADVTTRAALPQVESTARPRWPVTCSLTGASATMPVPLPVPAAA